MEANWGQKCMIDSHYFCLFQQFNVISSLVNLFFLPRRKKSLLILSSDGCSTLKLWLLDLVSFLFDRTLDTYGNETVLSDIFVFNAVFADDGGFIVFKLYCGFYHYSYVIFAIQCINPCVSSFVIAWRVFWYRN